MCDYDHTSKTSILSHAQQLLGKSLRDLHNEAVVLNEGRGRMGQCVEQFHFHYNPNSDPTPDFPQAGVELKCTPLKELQDGSMVPKERLVLNIIDYIKEAKATFETSSFKRQKCTIGKTQLKTHYRKWTISLLKTAKCSLSK